MGEEVYPNPADKYLTIAMESENTMGQVVLVKEMEELDKTILDISWRKLSGSLKSKPDTGIPDGIPDIGSGS